MGVLHVVDHNSAPTHANSGIRPVSVLTRVSRALRSGCFLAVFCLYCTLAIGLGQRLIIWPLVTLIPTRRRRIMRAWLRLHARATLLLARVLANIRVSVRGAIDPVSCVVVMNHQSVLDIPLGVSLIPGPQPLIPTRDRYGRGIPGISPLARLAHFPFVSQGVSATRAELRGLLGAADLVARGEATLLIYPEGHRTTDGAISPFMASGLRLLLQRARRPVYCVVTDGIWRARRVADVFDFADMRADVVVLGPFAPPEADDLDRFIEQLRERMIAALADLRGVPAESVPSVIDSLSAH
jgi:1-acyl-sn-glycerol-3-phosphate acyltransferase